MARLRDFAIVVVLFSLLIVSCITIIGGFENQYSVELDQNLLWKNDSFNNTFSRIGEMKEQSSRMANKTQSKGLTGLGIADTLAGGTWDVIVMVWNSFGFVGDFVTDASTLLHLPKWFVAGILTLITLGLVFTIISLFTRDKA